MQIKTEILTLVLSKMFGVGILHANYQTQQLHGGTLGNVQLVTGMATTADGRVLPYNVVLKLQKKWERPGDPNSWRREYDLYLSKFGQFFNESLRWPECYHAELNGSETQIWLEYIDGISGRNLKVEMLEQVALELGRFQGRLYQQPKFLRNITCLGDTEFLKRDFEQWHTQKFTAEFLISEQCRLPEFLKQMLKNREVHLYGSKSFEYSFLRSEKCELPEHLKKMLIDVDERKEVIFKNIQSLPVVLCHRDFWLENIFVSNGKTILIDWDGGGWGFAGEDIASLIVDETDVRYLDEYYRKFVPIYCRGLSEYIDISEIGDFYIWEMIIIKFGYRLVREYIFAQSSDVKEQQITALQKIYEMKDV